MMEFFLVTLRRLCDRLRLPVALGTHKLGLHVYAVENVAHLRMAVQRWKSWEVLEEELKSAETFIVPVCLDDGKFSRDCVLVSVCGEAPGVRLPAHSARAPGLHNRLSSRPSDMSLGDPGRCGL